MSPVVVRKPPGCAQHPKQLINLKWLTQDIVTAQIQYSPQMFVRQSSGNDEQRGTRQVLNRGKEVLPIPQRQIPFRNHYRDWIVTRKASAEGTVVVL